MIMKMNDTTIEAVILANGDYPTATVPLEILHTAPFVVCCDGGANSYIEQGYTPDIIIGDGDSLRPEYASQYAHIVTKVSEQESNDQTKAVNYLLAQDKRNIAIVGATGRREDHTIGNVSLLIEYARKGVNVRTYTDYGVFIPCNGSTTLQTEAGQQMSIFSIGARIDRAEGLLYPIYNFTNWWQGTLNECTGTSVRIEAEGEFLIFLTYR